MTWRDPGEPDYTLPVGKKNINNGSSPTWVTGLISLVGALSVGILSYLNLEIRALKDDVAAIKSRITLTEAKMVAPPDGPEYDLDEMAAAVQALHDSKSVKLCRVRSRAGAVLVMTLPNSTKASQCLRLGPEAQIGCYGYGKISFWYGPTNDSLKCGW